MLHQPVSSTVGPNFLMATASHSPLILCKSSFSPAHTKIHGFLQTSLHLLSHSRSSDKSQKKTLFRCTTLRCQAASPASNGVGSVFDLSSRIQSPTTSSLDFIRREPSKWRRVLLKVSGEALAGDGEQNVDPKITMSIAREVASVACLGIQVAIVVGGGNFFRGSTWAGCSGLDRATADYIGMTATVMNALLLQASMESIGMATRVQTAFRMSEVAEPYIRRRAIRHLEKGRVVIFAAGTGNPFFTTDTAAALRCAEIGAEVLLKATNVDGVYDKDPRLHADACLLEHITYQDIHSKSLAVMDLTAITLCQENSIPVVVFNLNKPGNIAKALKGDRVGTWIDKLRSSPGDQV